MVDNVPDLRVCALCTSPARYKCPRCATPSCSLPCSRRHKQDARCSGERDKVQYVPMNAYGWGVMMRDYCYLEDVGRKVSEWGSEIARGGYTTNVGARHAERTPKSSRRQTAGRSKRDLLRAHLETLGVDLELLPAGMERRKLNQSTFDQRSKRCLLTVEFVFYPPVTLALVSSSAPQSYKILSHRNDLSTTLLSVIERQARLALSRSQKQNEYAPDWLLPIVTPHPEAPECFTPPHCYIHASTTFPHASNVSYYHKLESILSIGELLQQTTFTEFPTVHVFDPDASSFCGVVIDKSGSMVRASEVDLPKQAKRCRINTSSGLKAISNLLGDYGSEASSHSEEDISTQKHQSGLVTLGAYSGSGDDRTPTTTGAEEDQSHSDDDESGEDSTLDPARLLEFVRQAQSAVDEDLLDWGDDWDSNAEQ